MSVNRPVARKRKYAWNVWRHIRLLFCMQHVKYCSEWLNRLGRWALWNARGYNYADYPSLSDHSDKQETWTLTTVCEEWESVEVRARTTRYAWTYVTSCDTQARIRAPPSTDFQVIEIGERDGIACLGWVRASWGSLSGVFSRHLLDGDAKENQWLTQVCYLYDSMSAAVKRHRNNSCYFRSIIIHLWRNRAWQKVVVRLWT